MTVADRKSAVGARAKFFLTALCVVLVASCAEEYGEEFFEQNQKLYSQHDEELIIRHFFSDKKEGVFLDVGSFHWEKLSTTAYLEKHLDWTGIAIDAQARFAPGYEAHRPKTKFFSYIVTDHSGTMETLYLAGGVSSTDEDWHQYFPKAKEQEPKPVQVPTITLNELLEQNNVERIDFLSMDIEGGEPDALKGFDIDTYRPALVCIETTPANKKTILDYFQSHGYRQIEDYLERDRVNLYFTPTEPDSLLVKLKALLGG